MINPAELGQAFSAPKGRDSESLYQAMCTENLMIPEWIPKTPEPTLSLQECRVAFVAVKVQNVILLTFYLIKSFNLGYFRPLVPTVEFSKPCFVQGADSRFVLFLETKEGKAQITEPPPIV